MGNIFGFSISPSSTVNLDNVDLTLFERLLKCCMLCGKCSMVCPRGINTRHLILSICKIYKED